MFLKCYCVTDLMDDKFTDKQFRWHTASINFVTDKTQKQISHYNTSMLLLCKRSSILIKEKVKRVYLDKKSIRGFKLERR